MTMADEKPLHPALVVVLAVVGVLFVAWAIAPLVAELVGAYLR